MGTIEDTINGLLETVSDLGDRIRRQERIIDALRQALKYGIESAVSPVAMGQMLAGEMEKAADE